MARQEEGLAEMRKALELDPTAEFTNMVSVHILYLARQYDKAIEQANNAIQLYPDSWATYFWLGIAYERKGMYEQAVEAYLKSKSFQGAKPEELAVFRNAYQKSGIRGYWQNVRDTVSGDASETCSMSSIYARLGETEQTIDYLNQDFQKHCPSISNTEGRFLLRQPSRRSTVSGCLGSASTVIMGGGKVVVIGLPPGKNLPTLPPTGLNSIADTKG
jgi:tetratricopeptide (TPR) repeat protein